MSLRASIQPDRTAAYAGIPVTATVTVANTADLVDAFEIRVLGIDRSWVECTPSRLQLFPETTGQFDLQIDLPDDFPAGLRMLTVQLRSDLKPDHPTLLTLTLEVDARPRLNVQAHPVQVVGASKGQFAVTVQNLGNTPVVARLTLDDPEALTEGVFDRPEIEVPPGEQRSTPLRVKAKRPLAGAPVVRALSVGVENGMPGSEQMVTFVQTPRISRLMFSFIGLLIAASIFGIVFSRNLKNVVDATTTDDALLEQAFGAADPGAGMDPGSITGIVVARSTKEGIAGATVELFLTAVPDRPIRSVATGDDGSYTFDNLGPGPFRMRAFAGGYEPRWFGDVATFDNSPDLAIASGEVKDSRDFQLVGQKATVSGSVIGGTVEGAQVALIVPAASTGSDSDAIIGTIEVDDTGAFEFVGVPAPGTYTLRVTRIGSIQTSLSLGLAGGEIRSGITVQLRSGDGEITGLVAGPDGPLENATITVTSTDISASTLSLSDPNRGAFVLPDLLTPATYALSVAREGYATENLTVSLASGQKINGLVINVDPATGSISGVVRDGSGIPIGGVSVTATDGDNTFSLTTVTVDDPITPVNEIGSFRLTGLPAPGVYTATLGGGIWSQVVRNVVLASGSLNPDLGNVDLVASTGEVSGLVTDANGPVGGVSVRISSGVNTRTTTTASSCPPADPGCIGRFRVEGLAPGTYTVTFTRSGSEPAARQIVIGEGASVTANVELRPRAGIVVVVCRAFDTSSTVPRCQSGQARVAYQVRLWKESVYPGGSATGSLLASGEGVVTFNSLDAPVRYVIEVAAVAGDPALTSRVVSLGARETQTIGILIP